MIFGLYSLLYLIHPQTVCVQSTVKVLEGSRTHFRSIAVVKRVFDHQPLEHLDGDLTDLSELLKSAAHLPHQQPHQEVVSTEVIRQRVVQLKICSRHRSTGMTGCGEQAE